MQNAELSAARTVLNKGVKMNVKAPLFIRLFKKTVAISIPLPNINTYAACLELYLKIGLTPEQSATMDFTQIAQRYVKGKNYASRLVARAILNSTFWGFLFTRILSWYIGRNAKVSMLYQVAEIIVVTGGIEDFMNFIGLAQTLNIMSQTSQQTTPTS